MRELLSSERIQSEKKHGQPGERETVSVPGQVGNMRGYPSQDQPAGPFTWNFRLNSSKLTELEVERMREVVRPWLVTGRHHYSKLILGKKAASGWEQRKCDCKNIVW